MAVLQNILEMISQALLAPTMVVLIGLIAFSVYSIGSVLAEIYTERRHYVENMPEFLQGLEAANMEDVGDYIQKSSLLAHQKDALVTLYDNRNLSGEGRFSLARKLTHNVVKYYKKKVSRLDVASRLAPMLGLMGTLIPLGPGIVALGNGDTSTLAASIGIAFNTTVAGLVSAVILIVLARIRRNWYEDYNVSLETAMTTLLEKIEDEEFADLDEYDRLIGYAAPRSTGAGEDGFAGPKGAKAGSTEGSEGDGADAAPRHAGIGVKKAAAGAAKADVAPRVKPAGGDARG